MQTDYNIIDVQERLFFVKKKKEREKLNLLCEFSNSMKCFTYLSVKDKITQIPDDYIVENVLNGNFDNILKEIFEKNLWSDIYQV